MRHIRPRFHNPCGIYSRSSAIYAVYTAGSPQSILCNNISYRNIQSSVRYISAQCRIADTEAYRYKLASFSIPQSPHYIKKAQGCAEGRGLVPLCGFLTFQCDLPSAGGRSLCAIQPEAAAYAAYTAGSPQSILCNNISYRNIQSSVRYISAQCRIADTEAYRYKLASFSIPQSPHYIKKAQGCAEGRGLVPLCGFLTFQCDLPSAGFRSPCGIQQGAAIYAVIRPEFRNPCGIYG